MHVKSRAYFFSFEKQIFSLKTWWIWEINYQSYKSLKRMCYFRVRGDPSCLQHTFFLWCNKWLIIFIQISFQIKREFMYYFNHCSCKYMKHANFSQLTLTPCVFGKKGQIMNNTKQTYMINVTTGRPASATSSHRMHVTLQIAVNWGSCWIVWQALNVILLCYQQSAFSLKDITHDYFEVTNEPTKQWPLALWQHTYGLAFGFQWDFHPCFVWKLGVI
jgi:hypothetical protein